VLAKTMAISATQVLQVVVLLLFLLMMIGVFGINLIGLRDAPFRRCAFTQWKST
jgi:hypothetical protein